MDWLEQAHALEQQGRIGSAIDVLEQGVATGGESSELYKELARLCLLVHEVRAFSNYCHEAIRLDPLDAEPHLMIARVLVEEQRWEEAVESLEQSLRIGGLSVVQKLDAETLLDQGKGQLAEWRRAHPGFSNL